MNLNELLEKAKTDKTVLRKLKMIAVESKLYELGASLRELENNLFPDTDDVKVARKTASDTDVLLRMVGIEVNELKTCWLLSETFALHRKRKDKFDMRDAAKLKAKSNELFS
jgi:hypothetical protein